MVETDPLAPHFVPEQVPVVVADEVQTPVSADVSVLTLIAVLMDTNEKMISSFCAAVNDVVGPQDVSDVLVHVVIPFGPFVSTQAAVPVPPLSHEVRFETSAHAPRALLAAESVAVTTSPLPPRPCRSICATE